MVIPNRSLSSLNQEQDKFKYQNKERDLERRRHDEAKRRQTGYDYFEARYFDSYIGRFLQVDPHGEKYANMNAYIGMFNNPIRVVDPTGMDGEDENEEDLDVAISVDTDGAG